LPVGCSKRACYAGNRDYSISKYPNPNATRSACLTSGGEGIGCRHSHCHHIGPVLNGYSEPTTEGSDGRQRHETDYGRPCQVASDGKIAGEAFNLIEFKQVVGAGSSV
jgi:hypothetical protein